MNNELTFDELAIKYPDIPKFLILKIDLYRRGIVYSDKLKEKYGKNPGPMVLRDGTSVLTVAGDFKLESYMIDLIDDKVCIYFKDRFMDEVEFSPVPSFYGKKTSLGTPMENVANARPQRLDIWAYRFCHFWEGGNQCKFCSVNAVFRDKMKLESGYTLNLQDISETVGEALKEPGRFSQITITGGADPSGDEPFDSELNRYIEVLQAVGSNFSADRIPSQLLCCAMSKKQIKKLHSETKLQSYCPDMEVWDKNLFSWICPAKEKLVGWGNWIKSMFDAVEIFGPGRVYTNIVAGCEMAEPYGFKTPDEALKSNLEGCEYLAKHGVAMMSLVWKPVKNSTFFGQKQPPLEYYLKLIKGLREIRTVYGLDISCDDYKHCGNHADSDFSRI